MSRRLTVWGEVKHLRVCIRSESESEQGVESDAVDPKPDDLSMTRVKRI